ncbi:hypothetical protein HRR81_003713 [Exophiala dermatitidis]|nr:hypothetical protein HRR73_001943 [Exophiala dermatitidis]KAJ4532867.1 hypothetical protein HRR76_007844 [Exophiala dermatitidis]KAJ4574011.1 hypothetical protein HRR79_003016 [Exophiala dermatitidis]KAJ4577259.1 hypothetical protein HRR81_003713 [Exophiala dermatitidis]KAJ4583725.1 hypothetical protein HRR82_003072 [Exophiala dermatitidis]
MRYRCEACGRYRSTKYHYRHPIPPGQLPAKTICRKCRDRATDSEDYTGTSESSPSSGSKYRDSRRSKQRNRSRNGRKARRSVSRVHSMRRGKTPDRHSSRYEESSATYSDSSELERRHPSGKYRQRQHSHASSGRERRRLRLSPCEERIYYEGRSVGRKHLDIPEDFEDDDYDYENPRGVRISSRAQSRTRRVVRRQDSDAYSGNPPQAEYYVERYEYIQQPPSRHHQRGYSPQQGPALPNVRDTSLPAHNRSQHPQQEDKDTHDQGAYDRLRSRSIPRGRLRSRENDFHYGGVYDGSPPYYTQLTPNKEIADPSQGRHGRRLVYAPSPPPARSSSLGYLADPEAEEKEQQHIRIGGSRRRRSRSRPLDVESSELRILRPGDELTVVERYAPRPNQDYERYDHEGIRVRVREI